MFKRRKRKVVAVAAGLGLALALALALFTIIRGPADIYAATNAANNVAGGSHSLTNSGNVTVNAAGLKLVKQVWVNVSGTWTCMASTVTADQAPEPDDRCNGSGPGSVTVPSGSTVKFLIYVRNRSDINLTDLRFQDILDVSAGVSGGFTYSTPADQIKRSATGGSEPSDTETVANIFANVDGATCPGVQCMTTAADGDIASYAASVAANQDRITVGNTTGLTPAQANGTLALNAHKTFAVLFQATKN
jgi:uncharacterized repeat protein (TIGR01451 family)